MLIKLYPFVRRNPRFIRIPPLPVGWYTALRKNGTIAFVAPPDWQVPKMRIAVLHE